MGPAQVEAFSAVSTDLRLLSADLVPPLAAMPPSRSLSYPLARPHKSPGSRGKQATQAECRKSCIRPERLVYSKLSSLASGRKNASQPLPRRAVGTTTLRIRSAPGALKPYSNSDLSDREFLGRSLQTRRIGLDFSFITSCQTGT